jgi:hypothetical protein
MSPTDYRAVLPRTVFPYPRRDSNSRQPACKAGALPLSYRGVLLIVGMTRFERATPWSQTRRAAKLRHIPLARMEGLEPPTLAALETTALPVELHP